MTNTTINHSDRAHASLSPSSSARWLTCVGSQVIIPIFEKKYPKKSDGSRHSRVGTIAHEVSECLILDKPVDRSAIVSANMHEDDEPLTDEEWIEIQGHALGFKEYVMRHKDEDDLLLVEKRVYMNEIDEAIYGTADIIIFKRETNTLLLIDLKYGMREVAAEDNTQLLLYLVGACEMINEMGYTVHSFEGHIYQPRVPGGIQHAVYNPGEIELFIVRATKAVEKIRRGDTTRTPSDKACQWCPVFGTEYCTESTELMARDTLKLIDELDQYSDTKASDMVEINKKLPKDSMDPSIYDLEDLAKMYLLFGAAKKWMERVEAHLKPIAEEGKLETLKVVEGRGSNTCISPEEVAFILGKAAWKEPALKSVTELTKFVGAKNFDNLLGDCFRKNPGKPSLVSSSDKRPALDTLESMISDLDDET